MNPLRRFRETQGMNQRAFALKAGIHQPTLSLIERSVRSREHAHLEGATAEHAAKIARAFGHAITEQQILYPADYMTAEDLEAMQPEPEVA